METGDGEAECVCVFDKSSEIRSWLRELICFLYHDCIFSAGLDSGFFVCHKHQSITFIKVFCLERHDNEIIQSRHLKHFSLYNCVCVCCLQGSPLAVEFLLRSSSWLTLWSSRDGLHCASSLLMILRNFLRVSSWSSLTFYIFSMLSALCLTCFVSLDHLKIVPHWAGWWTLRP